MNPLIIETVIKERRLEAEAYAKQCRLINLYNRANPSFIARIALLMGDILVRFGTLLQDFGKRHLGPGEDLYHRPTHS